MADIEQTSRAGNIHQPEIKVYSFVDAIMTPIAFEDIVGMSRNEQETNLLLDNLVLAQHLVTVSRFDELLLEFASENSILSKSDSEQASILPTLRTYRKWNRDGSIGTSTVTSLNLTWDEDDGSKGRASVGLFDTSHLWGYYARRIRGSREITDDEVLWSTNKTAKPIGGRLNLHQILNEDVRILQQLARRELEDSKNRHNNIRPIYEDELINAEIVA